MQNVKLFRKADQNFELDEYHSAINPLVNAGNSKTLGAGIGKFGAGCEMEWTVSYDEILFIHSGNFTLVASNQVFHASAGDTLWIPRGTPLIYKAEEEVIFFYAVYPVDQSPSTNTHKPYPEAAPERL